jgi:hypothetical protein
VKAVSADNPSRANGSAADNSPRGVKAVYFLSPHCYDANVLRAVYHDPMELSSANTHAEAAKRKRCFSLEFIVQKPYSAERRTMSTPQIRADAPQRINCIGHETFTTSLFYWRLSAIG